MFQKPGGGASISSSTARITSMSVRPRWSKFRRSVGFCLSATVQVNRHSFELVISNRWNTTPLRTSSACREAYESGAPGLKDAAVTAPATPAAPAAGAAPKPGEGWGLAGVKPEEPFCWSLMGGSDGPPAGLPLSAPGMRSPPEPLVMEAGVAEGAGGVFQLAEEVAPGGGEGARDGSEPLGAGPKSGSRSVEAPMPGVLAAAPGAEEENGKLGGGGAVPVPAVFLQPAVARTAHKAASPHPFARMAISLALPCLTGPPGPINKQSLNKIV